MKMTKKDRYRLKVLERRIAGGELEAMMEYAQRYQCRYPEEVTPAIAQKIVTCYETCLKAGNLTAALNLGAMYYGGEFIPRDFKKAMKYYEQATESDDKGTQLRAWTNLGYCYYYGRDPFAASLLPKIQKMLGEAKRLVESDLGLREQ